jgi:hypothetical protein
LSNYGASTRGSTSTVKRDRTLSMVAGALGILMFAFGFLRWLNLGVGGTTHKFSGYALYMPTSAVIALSLAAGLIAVLAASERRPGRGVHSAVPTGLAAASLLVAIGIFLGKGAISPTLGSKVGVEIGLILGLITAAVQTIVLAMGLTTRHDDGGDTRSGARETDQPVR